MLPDLDSLRLFVRTAELGSLTKAAAACHIAVAAASRRIAQLEHLYRDKLLLRTVKGVVLTPAGEVLRVHAARVIEEAIGLEAGMIAHAQQMQDTLRIFANTSAVSWFLPADLAEFKARHPGYQLEIKERQSCVVVDAVQSGEADMGIFNGEPPKEGLRCFAYKLDRLAAIVPRNHPLGSSEISFEEVLEFELVSLEPSSALAQLIIDKAAALDKPLQLRLQMKSFQSVCRMVKCGLGIGLLPLQALQEITKLFGLRSIPLSDAWATRPLWVCVRDSGPPRKALQALLEHLIPPGGRFVSPGRGLAAVPTPASAARIDARS